jgi:uncharacterized membrane protein
MVSAHFTNILIHAGAGFIAIVIGFVILSIAKGTTLHRRLGKIFGYLTLVVCCSAITGLVFFRFLPVFAVITALVLYQLVGGWRSAHTKQQGPAIFDAIWTLLAIAVTLYLIPIVLSHISSAKAIAYSTFGALATILIYDAIRWCFPRSWHQQLWRYEHSYKLLSALFGMLSAFVGNVVRIGQPWSQLVPSLMGVMVIGYFFCKLYKEDRKRLAQKSAQH